MHIIIKRVTRDNRFYTGGLEALNVKEVLKEVFLEEGKMKVNTNFPVRYTEIDSMHIVHHSNYIKWFEAGRRDFLKKMGIPVPKINDSGFFLPLSEIKCEYKSPARYGDEIIIITSIKSISCVKIRFEYKVLSKTDGKVLATGYTVHAWTNRNIEPVNIKKEAPEIYGLLEQLVESKDT